jgi:hypothetical protein
MSISVIIIRVRCDVLILMMMTEMDIETSVYYVHLTRLIAREDFIKFTRRESTKTYKFTSVSIDPPGKLSYRAPINLNSSSDLYISFRWLL